MCVRVLAILRVERYVCLLVFAVVQELRVGSARILAHTLVTSFVRRAKRKGTVRKGACEHS